MQRDGVDDGLPSSRAAASLAARVEPFDQILAVVGSAAARQFQGSAVASIASLDAVGLTGSVDQLGCLNAGRHIGPDDAGVRQVLRKVNVSCNA